MKFLVLGAAGMQGKAAVHDLCRLPEVREIVCADMNPDALHMFASFLDMEKITLRTVRADSKEDLIRLMSEGIDVVIDLLPIQFIPAVAEAAVEAGVSLVNTFYASSLPEDIHEKALAKGIAILPEMGLDPGIDLILCGYGVSRMDEVYELHSYCGGFPEPAAIDNPLKYKLTWIWDGVLKSYKRPARLMQDGRVIDIPAEEQHAPQWVETLEFPGVGTLELIPNGNAVVFGDLLGIADTLRNTSRRYMRWTGHAELLHALKQMKFLSDEPVAGLAHPITPHEFMRAHLQPQLQYQDGEKDIVAMRNIVSGRKDGQDVRITFDLVDYRDMNTGLFAMNRTVGYTASIAAQMIASGQIRGKGLLRSTTDIPYAEFVEQLQHRNIAVKETIEMLPATVSIAEQK